MPTVTLMLAKTRVWLSTRSANALHDSRGATAIEYSIIASAVGSAIAATVWGVGANLQTNFYDKLLTLF